MGCFDTVWFKCPRCGGDIQEQSKGGACELKNYNADAVPFGVASGVDGMEEILDHMTIPPRASWLIHCRNCKGEFAVTADPPVLRLSLRELTDAEIDIIEIGEVYAKKERGEIEE